MSVLTKVFGNTRKPDGLIGKMMARSMNGGHAKMADWGLTHLDPDAAGNAAVRDVCDFGCGGGRNVSVLLKSFPQAAVKGFDYSEVSVATAGKHNAKMIKAGRCEILQGDVSNITLPAESLDLATAFETVYFWPGLTHCFGQVAGTLRPGGRFLIVNEADGEDGSNDKWEKIIDMKTYTRGELKESLLEAGFSEVSTYHHPEKPWIAVLAVK